MSILTREWQEYDHDYTKDIHDIRTKDGKEYMNCWPNAGKFNVMAKEDKDCIQIPDAEVTHVRCNKDWMTEEEQETEEAKADAKRMLIVDAETAAIDKTLRSKEVDIVHDTPMKRGFTWNEYAESMIIENTYLPENYTKKHKPNTGLSIGSYKYRSKK